MQVEPAETLERRRDDAPKKAREGRKQKLDRELIELLQEMRVMLPGIEVIFGFLLTVPFTARFTELTSLQRTTFFVSFLSTAMATAFLVAPSSYHRMRWRQYDKENLLRIANKFAIIGLAFFAISLAGIAFIVTDVVIRTNIAVWVAAGVAAIVILLWFGLPLFRRAEEELPD
jgi:amino acid transporter